MSECVSCAVSLSYLFVPLFVVWAVSLVWGFFFELCLLWVTVTSYTSSLSYILFRLHLWHNMTTLPCCTYALSCHAELWFFLACYGIKRKAVFVARGLQRFSEPGSNRPRQRAWHQPQSRSQSRNWAPKQGEFFRCHTKLIHVNH